MLVREVDFHPNVEDGVEVYFDDTDLEACPEQAAPVGGLVIPADTLAIVAPWLVIIGLVGCVGTVVVIAKKRRE